MVFGHLSTLDRLTCLFFCTVITVLAILHRCLKREGLCNWEQLEKDIGPSFCSCDEAGAGGGGGT